MELEGSSHGQEDLYVVLEIKRTPYLFEYFLKTLDLDCGIYTIMGDAKFIAWSAHISAVLWQSPSLQKTRRCPGILGDTVAT